MHPTACKLGLSYGLFAGLMLAGGVVGAARAAAATPQKVRCPVLAIHGVNDRFLLPQGFNGTWQWVDGDVTLVSIPGAGHFIQHEQAELVTRAMLAWLDR